MSKLTNSGKHFQREFFATSEYKSTTLKRSLYPSELDFLVFCLLYLHTFVTINYSPFWEEIGLKRLLNGTFIDKTLLSVNIEHALFELQRVKRRT